MQIFLGKNSFLYKKSAYLQHLATVASGELLQMAGFFEILPWSKAASEDTAGREMRGRKPASNQIF